MKKTGDERGFGLFAKRRVSFEEVRSELLGWLSPVFEGDYDRLNAAKHPSLFEFGRSYYVLIGAMSLANHDCAATVGFSEPIVVPRAILAATTTPAFVRLSGDTRLLQISDKTERRDHGGWEQGEEILVRYGNAYFGNNNCKCSTCAKSHGTDVDVVGSGDLTDDEPRRKLIKL